MRILAPLPVGSALNLAAVSGLACLDPGPVAWPRLSARHPLASYTALATAAFGNGWELFTVVAVACTLCLLVSGWRRRRGGA